MSLTVAATATPVGPADRLAERTTRLLVEARAAEPARRRQLHTEVVTTHLWLAESVSARFRFRGEEADDLLQVARIGLIEACDRFRPERGVFVAFAAATITGVLKRHLRDHGWTVRPPRRTQELATEMWQQWPALVQRLGRVPSERELADQLGQTVASVATARYASQGYRATPLEVARTRGSQFATRETAAEIARLEDRWVLDDVLAQLAADERRLLWLRFDELRTQSEIAGELGVSQMQVSRLLSRLLGKLRLLITGPAGFGSGHRG